MANEKRLIDANALLIEYCQSNGCNEVIDEVCPNCFAAGLIANAPTVDAVEVVYCEKCVNHGNCLPEDVFRMARIEKPYCCAGKVDGDRNA